MYSEAKDAYAAICSGASKLRPVREIISPSCTFHSVKS